MSCLTYCIEWYHFGWSLLKIIISKLRKTKLKAFLKCWRKCWFIIVSFTSVRTISKFSATIISFPYSNCECLCRLYVAACSLLTHLHICFQMRLEQFSLRFYLLKDLHFLNIIKKKFNQTPYLLRGCCFAGWAALFTKNNSEQRSFR